MKKGMAFLGFLFLTILALAGGAWAQSAGPGIFTYDAVMEHIYPKTGGRFMRMKPVMMEDTFYACLDDGVVYAWKAEEAAPQRLCDVPQMPEDLNYEVAYEDWKQDVQEAVNDAVTILAAGDGKLYGLNQYSGKIGEITKAGITWSANRFDPAPFLYKGSSRAIHYTVVKDDTIYALTDYDEEGRGSPWNCAIVAINMITGDTAIHRAPGMQEMCLYRDNSLLLLRHRQDERSGYELTLSILNPASGEVHDLPAVLPGGGSAVGALAYDPALDAMYLTDAGSIWCSVAGGGFQQMTPHAFGFMLEFNQGWVLPRGEYALWLEGIQIFCPKADESSGNTLHLRLFWKDESMYNAFMAEHPDVTLYMQYGQLTAADIGEMIRSGDEETDIFQVYVDSSFRTLMDKGYAASLASEAIAADADTLYPAIQAAIRNAQGEVVAYPQKLILDLWQVNPYLWRTYFGEEPVPVTFSDFFDDMLRFEQGRGPEDGVRFLEWYTYESMVKTVIDAYIQQNDKYATAPMTFDRPELKEALQKLMEVNAFKTARGDTQGSGEYARLSDEEVLKYALFNPLGGNVLLADYFAVDEGAYVNMLPLAFSKTDAPVIRGYLSVLMVNPASKNQELAREYIVCATKAETDPERYYALHPGANEPYENPRYAAKMKELEEEKEELTAQIQKAEMDETQAARLKNLKEQMELTQWYLDHQDTVRWKISSNALENWRRLVPSIRFFENSLYVSRSEETVQEQISGLCSRFCAGQLDADGFLRHLDEVSRLIYLEQR